VRPRAKRYTQLLAIFVASLVLTQSSGVARALNVGTVHCCCGPHSVARLCACLRCPVKLKRAAQHSHGLDEDVVRPLGACAPSSEDGALVVLATLPIPPSLNEVDGLASSFLRTVRPLFGRQPSTPRPPPRSQLV
jgi:hypothetical protein